MSCVLSFTHDSVPDNGCSNLLVLWLRRCMCVCLSVCVLLSVHLLLKGKEEYLYSAFCILCISQSAQAWITQFYLQIHHAFLSFVSVHQMAPPITEVRDIQLQLTTHLSSPKGWKAELAWFVDLRRTVYPHKWSPVSYRSSAGQFAGQSPTFYHWATQPSEDGEPLVTKVRCYVVSRWHMRCDQWVFICQFDTRTDCFADICVWGTPWLSVSVNSQDIYNKVSP